MLGMRKRQFDAHETGDDGRPGPARRPAPEAADLRAWIAGMQLVNLPSFVTSEQFLDQVAAMRGRDIRLVETDALPASVCGLWMKTDHHDVIVVNGDITGPRRDLVILHEAAHVLRGHRGRALAPGRCEALQRALAPDVAAVETLLLRSHFDNEQEWEAEWLATYFLSRTRGTGRQTWLRHRSTQRAAEVLYGSE